MPWDEALRLMRVLLTDPSSAVTAACQGWGYPITREALVMMDLFDLTHQVNSKKKPTPHAMRPSKVKPLEKRGRAGQTMQHVRDIIARRQKDLG